MRELKRDTFAGCTALTAITLPDGAESIGDKAFSGCTALTDVFLPDSLRRFAETAFADCGEALLLHGSAGSAAERFAERYALAFRAD